MRFGDGRHHAHPVRRQPRAEHVDRQDDAPGQPGDGGVALHHVAVGEHVGAADAEAAVDVGRHARAADEIAQHVADGDRLDAGLHPARGDHDREPFGDVAEHLERRRAGPQDHRRLEHRRRDAAREQDLADLLAAGQVRGEVLALGAGRVQAAEVDDAPDPGLARRPAEHPRGPPVRRLELRAGAQGVHQVVGDVDAGEGAAQGLVVAGVRPDDLDVGEPGTFPQGLRTAGQRAHPPARGEQLRHEPAADVPGHPGDQREPALPARQPGGGHRGVVGGGLGAVGEARPR